MKRSTALTKKNNARVLPPRAKVGDAAIREGLADLKAGRTTPQFSSVEEFRAYRKKRLFMSCLQADQEKSRV